MTDDEMHDGPHDERDEDDDKPAVGSREALAAGAAGSAIGGAGAAMLTGGGSAAAVVGGAVGPAGVPLAGSIAGPAGVPLVSSVGVGSSGVPISGAAATAATGVPMSAGSAPGPVGVGINAPIKVARRGRIIGMVAAGAAAVAVVAGVAIVNGDDNPTVSPAPTVQETVEPKASTTAVASTDTTNSMVTTVPSSVAALVGPACSVGSWIADNESFGQRFLALAGDTVSDVSVTGEVRVDIAADGAVTTTFTDFVVSAQMPGAGTTEMSETGTESSTITFEDGGSYSVVVGTIASTQVLSSGGVVYLSGLSPTPVFESGSTYTCVGDELVMTLPGDPGDFVETFHRSG